jgi:hypothetical protein
MRSSEAGAAIAGENDCEQQLAGHESVTVRPAIGQLGPIPLMAMGQPGAQAWTASKAQG